MAQHKRDQLKQAGAASTTSVMDRLALATSCRMYFFLSSCPARSGSDGHQNVLSLISYSHIVREQLKAKSQVSSKVEKKNQPQTQTQPKTTQPRRHPEN